MQKPFPKLKELTSQEYLKLTERGNAAIDLALQLTKDLNKTQVLIQDQGGWLHYQKAPPRFNLKINEIQTDYGLTDLKDLKQKVSEKTVFLCNSMPGYFALENMKKINQICQESNCLLINDVSGSISHPQAKVGDIILGSFGQWKPINLKYGGFIASNNKQLFDLLGASQFNSKKISALLKKINQLPQKLKSHQEVRKKVLSDLKSFDIIHPNKKGINVIIKYNQKKEKEKITNYCNKNNLPFVLCPKYIRVKEKAISIEIKRLKP